MKRRLFNLTVGVSLVVCIATVGLWVRSYWWSDWIAWRSTAGWGGLRAGKGYLEVNIHRVSGNPAEFHGPKYERQPSRTPMNLRLFLNPDRGDRHTSWEWAGFALWTTRKTPGPLYVQAVVPLWSLAGLSAVPPVAWICLSVRRRLRQRQATLGLCPTCGYDLRATPERCPECGTAAVEEASRRRADALEGHPGAIPEGRQDTQHQIG